MTTGMEGGLLRRYRGERYRQVLGARRGAPAPAAFVRVGREPGAAAGRVEAGRRGVRAGGRRAGRGRLPADVARQPDLLAAVGFLPGRCALDDLSQLRGKRIAVGPGEAASGNSRWTCSRPPMPPIPPPSCSSIPCKPPRRSRRAGGCGHGVRFGRQPVVPELLNTHGIRLMSFSQAEAYSSLFPVLSHVVLPGGLDPARRPPRRRTSTCSPRRQT